LQVALAVRRDGGSRNTLFLSSGQNANLTDALTIDPVAAEMKAPVLLLPSRGPLPAGYRKLLYTSAHTYVVGAAASYPFHPPHLTRLAGVDRYATATLVNELFFAHPMGVIITNAAGAHLVDALTAGPWAGRQDFPIVMVSSQIIPGPTYDYLQSITGSLSALEVAGGQTAVSTAMTQALLQLIH
jgi:hypothetical protein